MAAVAMAIQPALSSAQAAETCLKEAEVSAMLVYAMPHAIRGISSSCSTTLASDGFLANGAGEMSSRYLAEGDAAWPAAFSAFMTFIRADEAAQTGGFALDKLPEELVRPLVDELIAQKVAEGMKVEDCRKFERVGEAIAPLEPHEVGNLVAVVLDLTDVDKPSICPSE